jgi:acyl carrier protein
MVLSAAFFVGVPGASPSLRRAAAAGMMKRYPLGRGAALQNREALEAELKSLIVESLALEDIDPAEIESGAPLFVEGLGLDSIDALELAMALEERFGVKIGEDPEVNQRIFASVASLASFVEENRVR